jgi:hypothetical protein
MKHQMHYLPKNKFLYVIYIIDEAFVSGQKTSQTMNSINRAEQSGEVLRGVFQTSAYTSQTKSPAGSAPNPEIEVTSVQPTDKREIPAHWEKVHSYTFFLSLSKM